MEHKPSNMESDKLMFDNSSKILIINRRSYMFMIGCWISKITSLLYIALLLTLMIFLSGGSVAFAGARFFKLTEEFKLISWSSCDGPFDCFWNELCYAYQNNNVSYVAFKPNFPDHTCSCDNLTFLINKRLDIQQRDKMNQIWVAFIITSVIMTAECIYLIICIIFEIINRYSEFKCSGRKLVIIVFMVNLFITTILVCWLSFETKTFINMLTSNIGDKLPNIVIESINYLLSWGVFGTIFSLVVAIIDLYLQYKTIIS